MGHGRVPGEPLNLEKSRSSSCLARADHKKSRPGFPQAGPFDQPMPEARRLSLCATSIVVEDSGNVKDEGTGWSPL